MKLSANRGNDYHSLQHKHDRVGAPRIRLLSCLAFVACMSGPVALAAEDGIAVSAASGPPVTLTEADIAALPTHTIEIAFATEHGPTTGSFEGPLLWAMLDRAHAIEASKPGGQVRQSVLVTGRDGYTALLALGEIAPEFEAKSVIVAERLDGRPLGSGHLRLLVPGDKRGGRSVRDVTRITVLAPQAP